MQKGLFGALLLGFSSIFAVSAYSQCEILTSKQGAKLMQPTSTVTARLEKNKLGLQVKGAFNTREFTHVVNNGSVAAVLGYAGDKLVAITINSQDLWFTSFLGFSEQDPGYHMLTNGTNIQCGVGDGFNRAEVKKILLELEKGSGVFQSSVSVPHPDDIYARLGL